MIKSFYTSNASEWPDKIKRGIYKAEPKLKPEPLLILTMPLIYEFNCLYCGKLNTSIYPSKKYCDESHGKSYRERRRQTKHRHVIIPFHQPAEEGYKICSTCDKELPIIDFYKCTTSKDGIMGQCKSCFRRYIKENKDKVYTYSQEYHDNYQATHKAKVSEYLLKSRNKRELIFESIECTLTDEQWNKIIEGQGGKCNKCGKKFTENLTPTIDHIKPITKKGNHTMENTQALCRSCNSKKGARLDHENIVTWLSP